MVHAEGPPAKVPSGHDKACEHVCLEAWRRLHSLNHFTGHTRTAWNEFGHKVPRLSLPLTSTYMKEKQLKKTHWFLMGSVESSWTRTSSTWKEQELHEATEPRNKSTHNSSSNTCWGIQDVEESKMLRNPRWGHLPQTPRWQMGHRRAWVPPAPLARKSWSWLTLWKTKRNSFISNTISCALIAPLILEGSMHIWRSAFQRGCKHTMLHGRLKIN